MIFKKITLLSLLLANAIPAFASQDTQLLRQTAPELHALYRAYPSYHGKLEKYAEMQGFKGASEKLITVVHELIHIESASGGGYLIGKQFFSPYMEKQEWPNFSFSEFREVRWRGQVNGLREPTETMVFYRYVTNANDNNLMNLADELNAYSQTVPWLCQYFPDQQKNSLTAFRDMTRLTNAFLRALHYAKPTEYQKFFLNQKTARNLLALVVNNSLVGLSQCGIRLPLQEIDELNFLVRTSKMEANKHH